MWLRKAIIPVLMGLLPLVGYSQAIDNTLSFKNINSDKYLRINYENDFFSATDKYYTQGLHLELVSPAMARFPLSKLLLHPAYGYSRYGIGFEHDGYTPSNFDPPDILYGDRPFAACLFLKTFVISADPIHHQRFSSALNTGIIGQAAGGMEMQTSIHRVLGDMMPHGWPNQIHNDAIVNYQADYEKQLLSYKRIFSLAANGTARAGTLSDKAGLGATVMIGYFSSPFDSVTATANNFRIYAYEHPSINAIAYDATLEGGVFNRTSPYTIDAGSITPVTFENRFGFVVVYQRFYLEYFQSFLSKEFTTGNFHVWGGIQIAFGL